MNIINISHAKNCYKVKFLGLTIFSRWTDKEEYFIFLQILFRIIYIKYDILLDSVDIRIFGIRFFRTKLHNQFKIYYFFFVPIFIQNISVKFKDKFIKNMVEKYPNYDDYYVFLCRSGEFFLLMHHFKEYLKKNNSKNFVLIFMAKYHLNICKMFYPDIPMRLIKRVNVPMVSKGISSTLVQYKNKKIYVPFTENYFENVEIKIRNNNAHYYEELKKHLRLSDDNKEHYKICEKTQNKISRIVKYILNNKFIFISPETLSNEPMVKNFWNNLCKEFKTQGYEIFCNAMFFGNLIEGTQSVFLTYEESIELSKYAKAIIGMRSGFLECISQNNVPMFALYTDFPKRSGFKRLKADKVLSGFSISKLPNVNNKLLYEYNVNEYENEEEIIIDIIDKINSQLEGE